LEHVFKEHTIDWPASSHHFPIVCLDLSSDGKWLAAARFSSGKGAIHVFALTSKNEDGQYQHWWSIPKMDAPTTCIKFLGEGSVESSLAVGCSNNEVYIYNLGRRSLSHWSNDMGVPILKSLPRELTSRSEPIARIVTNPERPQRFILGSHGYFCVVDLDQPVPVRSSMFPSDHLRANRLILTKEDDKACQPLRKNPKGKMAGSANTQTNFTICLRYCEILFQDFVANDEMVIVEEPWMSILEELPDALARRAYGT
jgi:U3 small nucleolar RNA-associated protein 4